MIRVNSGRTREPGSGSAQKERKAGKYRLVEDGFRQVSDVSLDQTGEVVDRFGSDGETVAVQRREVEYFGEVGDPDAVACRAEDVRLGHA